MLFYLFHLETIIFHNHPLSPSLPAARHSDEGSQEYLCKWRGVPYSESTWEEASLICHWYQDKIDDYLERNSSDRIPNKNTKVLRHRPRFMFMKEQLDSLNSRGSLKLRDYQLDGVNWLARSWCKYVLHLLNGTLGLLH